ncbi:hypothetical protein CRV08_15655 [Halarcobacter ebronensis]|uniref:Uncharacterized protein n=1 Tax=Halarcobacter ebronensis TaxID=1462615 RepID=A0A4Q0Y730_9BACT|nr:hypothetical protein [Halarcobacter ebronensis]RXJ65224.1 hypothetical protein CRV08_15655 [Halarcobacter ebronensis]
MGVDIKDSFHLEDTTNVLYEGVNEITLEATSGISLRCGGNVATVDSSGIFFKTPNYVKNSGENGVDGTEVGVEGEVINTRITNMYDTFISKVIDEKVILQADTTLKEGRSVEATLFILDKDENILAQETQTTQVHNNKIKQEYNLEQIIKSNDLLIEKIYELDGELVW